MENRFRLYQLNYYCLNTCWQNKTFSEFYQLPQCGSRLPEDCTTSSKPTSQTSFSETRNAGFYARHQISLRHRHHSVKQEMPVLFGVESNYESRHAMYWSYEWRFFFKGNACSVLDVRKGTNKQQILKTFRVLSYRIHRCAHTASYLNSMVSGIFLSPPLLTPVVIYKNFSSFWGCGNKVLNHA